jgi:7-cyano-7-deazaguanine synthase
MISTNMKKPKKAVILLSGGLDSATCLAVAREKGFLPYALSFNYGQRHGIELQAAQQLAASIGVAKHLIMTIDLRLWGGSALTDQALAVPAFSGPSPTVPSTYVPARNTIFLSLATAWAETLGARDLFIGVNARDYSGYPDCRPEFIRAFARCATLGTKAADEGWRFRIHAPLQDLSKAEIIKLGVGLGINYALTHSCYDPSPAGLACGRCDSCEFRRQGFRAAGVPDPTAYVQRH